MRGRVHVCRRNLSLSFSEDQQIPALLHLEEYKEAGNKTRSTLCSDETYESDVDDYLHRRGLYLFFIQPFSV